MNWVLEHFQLVVLVGGAIAYWLNQRRKAKEEAAAMRELEAQQTQSPAPAPVNDEAERVRRIQEEIRRKILERTGGAAPKPQPPPISARNTQETVVPKPASAEVQAPEKPDAYTQASSEDQTVSLDQAILERQQQLSAQLLELDEKRRHTVGKAEAFAEKTAAVMAASGTAVRGSLLADLRNPVSVRRAIVLREVLGTPVGLR